MSSFHFAQNPVSEDNFRWGSFRGRYQFTCHWAEAPSVAHLVHVFTCSQGSRIWIIYMPFDKDRCRPKWPARYNVNEPVIDDMWTVIDLQPCSPPPPPGGNHLDSSGECSQVCAVCGIIGALGQFTRCTWLQRINVWIDNYYLEIKK